MSKYFILTATKEIKTGTIRVRKKFQTKEAAEAKAKTYLQENGPNGIVKHFTIFEAVSVVGFPLPPVEIANTVIAPVETDDDKDDEDEDSDDDDDEEESVAIHAGRHWAHWACRSELVPLVDDNGNNRLGIPDHAKPGAKRYFLQKRSLGQTWKPFWQEYFNRKRRELTN